MKSTGRKSAASLSVVTDITGISRLKAPDYLDDKIKSVWVQIVNSKSADWFGKEHISMLEALCRHIVQAQSLSAMIDVFDITWALEDEGLKRLEKLQKMHRLQTQAQENLMRAMRLTHQAIYRADKAPTITSAANKRPWQSNNED